jgi:DNA polymerase-3 subunit epsilon
MRQIVLDTETTGIDPREGHRLIEIGAIELVNRRFTGRTYHQYINPEREVEAEAIGVHGITNEFLDDKPVFAAIAGAFWEFVRGAELVIHNAAFDVGFIDHEFKLLLAARGEPRLGPVAEHCGILDTLQLARTRHPGQRNNLDALCKRYVIDNGHRVLHGALLDAEILAEVYLAMTGGQTALTLDAEEKSSDGEGMASGLSVKRLSLTAGSLRVLRPDDAELTAHRAKLEQIRQASGSCHWDALLGQPQESSDAAP